MSEIFRKNDAGLGWCDVLWGFERGLCAWRDVVEFAKTRTSESDELARILRTIGKDRASEIGDLLRDSVGGCDQKHSEKSKNKWLYLVLRSISENRQNLDDPRDMIDSIYADFEYPELLEECVSFFPPRDGYDPTQHTEEENSNRFWRKVDSLLARIKSSFDLT